MITIYDIKNSLNESSHFFDRDTMKFFGQTIKDFKVKKSPLGRIFIYAPSYWDGKLMGFTFSEFIDNKLQNIPLNTLIDIEEFIKEN